MTTHVSPSLLAQGAEPLSTGIMSPVSPPSRAEIYGHVIAYLDGIADQRFQAIPDIEGMTAGQVRALRTAGTPLEPVERALSSIGISTNGTVGGLMDSPLALDREHVHEIACYCKGDHFSAGVIAGMLENIQKRAFPWPA